MKIKFVSLNDQEAQFVRLMERSDCLIFLVLLILMTYICHSQVLFFKLIVFQLDQLFCSLLILKTRLLEEICVEKLKSRCLRF